MAGNISREILDDMTDLANSVDSPSKRPQTRRHQEASTQTSASTTQTSSEQQIASAQQLPSTTQSPASSIHFTNHSLLRTADTRLLFQRANVPSFGVTLHSNNTIEDAKRSGHRLECCDALRSEALESFKIRDGTIDYLFDDTYMKERTAEIKEAVTEGATCAELAGLGWSDGVANAFFLRVWGAFEGSGRGE